MTTLITNNFDIDWWIKLAGEHPFKFEQQREQWLENIIQSARPFQKPRLKGLIWEIKMDLEIARNKYRNCPSISERLVSHLLDIKEILEGTPTVYFNPKSADILDFVIPRD